MWIRQVGPNQQEFYFNPITMESRWDLPEEDEKVIEWYDFDD
jgi:hypothetical protein